MASGVPGKDTVLASGRASGVQTSVLGSGGRGSGRPVCREPGARAESMGRAEREQPASRSEAREGV